MQGEALFLSVWSSQSSSADSAWQLQICLLQQEGGKQQIVLPADQGA